MRTHGWSESDARVSLLRWEIDCIDGAARWVLYRAGRVPEADDFARRVATWRESVPVDRPYGDIENARSLLAEVLFFYRPLGILTREEAGDVLGVDEDVAGGLHDQLFMVMAAMWGPADSVREPASVV